MAGFQIQQIYKLKVVIVGPISVGKTSLAVRFAKNTYEDIYNQTIGASFISRSMDVGNRTFMFQLWDTAGQERYHCLVPMYLRDSHIALVLYDITDMTSFGLVTLYLDLLQKNAPERVVIVLVGNKEDRASDRVVTTKMGRDFAQTNKLLFMETSAKTGQNVDDVFILASKNLPNEISSRRHFTKVGTLFFRRKFDECHPLMRREGVVPRDASRDSDLHKLL
ncbi:ras-related protein Rab-5A-like [Liolophura sinensis]|uniref:ras-related protein Rab-5A-like n=1 Tax=Liolophura sinensis TaxID=3198878 RepID=UPI0031597ABE